MTLKVSWRKSLTGGYNGTDSAALQGYGGEDAIQHPRWATRTARGRLTLVGIRDPREVSGSSRWTLLRLGRAAHNRTAKREAGTEGTWVRPRTSKDIK